MAITKSWEESIAVRLEVNTKIKQTARQQEMYWLIGASVMVIAGLVLVLFAKTQDFAEQQLRIDRHELIDLNGVQSPEQLLPGLTFFSERRERQLAADRLFHYLEANRPLPNVGALARLRVSGADLHEFPDLVRVNRGASSTLPLFALSKFKQQFMVRTPLAFVRAYIIWTLAFVGAFWFVHVAWRWRRFRGDPAILPALLLLTGMGVILMVSLRDPLRDTLEFKKFVWGVDIGCAMLLLPLLRSFQHRHFSQWVYTPLLLALALFGALLALGSGPTGSDAKVNLGPFQPVELIKILIVFFMAGYFARRWEWLRDLSEKNFVPRWMRWLELPRFSHALPVMCGVASALLLFFVLKDMGPALVMGFVFLIMFGVARGKAGLALLGIITLVSGVAVGYHIGSPHTVVERVAMWRSPWDNDVRGGDQLAHSLWAFATGGPWGSGPGWGDPALIPAGHTDLVLPAIGEEWGFAGVAAIFFLLLHLVRRALRIAVDAADEYATFLAVGLGALVALEMLLISGGALGAVPLSGVVSPFLSSGNTAMLSNFLIFAILLSISNQSARAADDPEDFREAPRLTFYKPVRIAGVVLAVCALLLVARAATIQMFQDKELMVAEAHVITQDGVKRLQRNPRLNLLAASIPRGNIYDRNGILLATNSWEELEKRRAEFQQLGISIDGACSRGEARHYPFGSFTAHLLGDLRTQDNFHATNTSFVERDSGKRLQGYDNYQELGTVVRYRHQRSNPALITLLSRDRDVHTTIDIRLQVKATEILRNELEKVNKKGALVMMNSQTGDVLALVSYPEPAASGHAGADELLDRARYGEYPPGSTFKLVTAMAALRRDPQATHQTFACRRLADGRAGTIIRGWRREIRDDVGDHAHGTLDLGQAIAVSCNAYFAQLGVYKVGAQALHEAADRFGISTGDVQDLRKMLPFAAYGQGAVLTTPFKMARVAATVSSGGLMPEGRWVLDASNSRTAAPVSILDAGSAAFLARAMRSVVTSGTARSPMAGAKISIAGKTGTAQLDSGDPHAWFAGFAPYDGDPSARVAFAVVVEHGGYGAKLAAPIARQLVEAAAELGLLGRVVPQKR